jgi:uncharacterized protein YcbK (DUF882 family)
MPLDTSRRALLKLGGAAAVALLRWPAVLEAAVSRSRVISFYGVHTGERLTVEYFTGGRYQPDALRAIDHMLRDRYTDLVHPIDRALVDLLYVIRRTLGSNEAFQVLSGYRSRATNEWKRQQDRGVAEHSYHTRGQALDFSLPDRDASVVRQVAIGLQSGGVGYYPRSAFVHVDTGPVRTWAQQTRAPRERARRRRRRR